MSAATWLTLAVGAWLLQAAEAAASDSTREELGHRDSHFCTCDCCKVARRPQGFLRPGIDLKCVKTEGSGDVLTKSESGEVGDAEPMETTCPSTCLAQGDDPAAQEWPAGVNYNLYCMNFCFPYEYIVGYPCMNIVEAKKYEVVEHKKMLKKREEQRIEQELRAKADAQAAKEAAELKSAQEAKAAFNAAKHANWEDMVFGSQETLHSLQSAQVASQEARRIADAASEAAGLRP